MYLPMAQLLSHAGGADHPSEGDNQTFRALLKVSGSDHSPLKELIRSTEEAGSTRLCGQGIKEIDDAAVDHLEQHWRGGWTIPKSARLTHRYCNMARPRSD